MKPKEKSIPAFLSGGGEMGALIRSFDWSTTAVGSPDTWPQTLRIAVSIMLDCPFGMYIAWGNEYIQMYNDGYRPILGSTKHPQALGISTPKTFEEVWPTIGPMFEGVMRGTPVGFPDFVLQLDRNGFVEECVFDFSYSPIRFEDGEVGGVLVTVIETTEKVNNYKKLIESKDQLNFIIETTELGTWDYIPLTNKFVGNNRLKDWFGLPHEAEVALSLAIDVMLEKDRRRVEDAIHKALQYESGGHYDIEYTIVNPVTKQERIVRAKGRAWFGDDKIAYRFNGTLLDITKETIARKKIEASEQRLRNFIMQSPAMLALLKEPEHRFELISPLFKQFLGNREVIGKTLHKAIPEIKMQGLIELLDKVYKSGETFTGNEMPVKVDRGNGLQQFYLNLTYQAFKNDEGKIEGILVFAYDVTEQVEARKQIEESNKQLRTAATLTENIADAVVGTDMDNKTISWNKGAESLYGYAGEEVMGNCAMELLNTQFLSDEDKQAMPISISSTGKWHGEVVQSKKDGTPVNVLVSIAYVYDEKGKPIAAIAVNRDITERKKVEEKIKESEAKFRTLAATIPNMICTATPDGKKNFFNQYFLDYTGLSFEELKGDGMLKIIFPEDLEKDLRLWDHALKTGEDFIMEKRLRHHDGTYRWHLSHSIAQKDEKGKIIAWIGCSTEIEEQKKFTEALAKGEEQFRTFANCIQNLAWIANCDGWIYWYNQQWYDYTGTTFEEMEGWGWQKVHHPDQVEKIVALSKELWKKDEPFELTFPLRKHDGEYRWFLTRAFPVKDANGNIERWLGTNTDIHEQKTAGHKKDEFISIASHEMKTPLTTAKGYLQLLMLTIEEENPTASLYAHKAANAVERLHDLVAELLDASKIHNGRLNYIFSTFDFNEMLDETIENIQHGSSRHTITKHGKCLHDIKGDKNRLQQVIINLLTNAIKYSPNANIVLVEIEEKQNALQVSVRDYGVGMKKQHLDKIFERYYRVEEHAVHFQGLGIGLYISCDIITRHGGKMWAESEPGKGSTFYFTIPI